MTTLGVSESARVTAQLRNKADWKQLVSGRVDAIHVKSFATVTECAELVAFVEQHPRATSYKTATGVRRLGSSLNDVRKSGEISNEYSKPDILEEVLAVNGAIARLVGTIAASWPLGLETYSYAGFPLHRSIARIIVGGSAEPHDDNIAKELPEDQVAQSVQHQLGLNLYIQVPDSGGELEGWHKRLSSNEYEALRNPEPGLSYGVRREEIGSSDWTIKPCTGDLIIFINSELHAIRSSQGTRATWGFFLGYRSDNLPFLIWS